MINNFSANINLNELKIHSDTKKFIGNLIQRDPGLRYSVSKALEHQVFAQLDSCMDNTLDDNFSRFNTS